MRTIKPTTQNLIKILCLSLVCGLLPPFGRVGVGQNNSLVLNGANIVLDGGTATNNIHVVIDQSNPQGIVRLSAGGHIHSENQYNFITWLTAATTGSYLFPFGVGGNATDYIPFTFNKTAGNSNVSMSTWFTNPQNLPKPLATNVGPVTNMTGITDSVIYAIDRFWDIQAPSTTADLTFSYRGIENTTTNPTFLVQAQHWNGTNWDAPVGPGTTGVTAGIGAAGPFMGQNTFSPWVLITTCTTDTLTQNPIICQGSSITVGTNIYTTTGTFIDTLTNSLGCDSIITTNLTVNPTTTSTDIQTACTPITWIDGNNYTTSTNTPTFTIVGGAANGCDSIVTLNLTINSAATGTDVITSCTPITWIDGNNYAVSTTNPTFTIVGGAANGCDSIVTLNLTINSTATGTDVITSCTPITWIDGNNYAASTNTPTFTIVGGAANGCDSIVTLNLTINPTATFTDVQTICGNSFTWIDGINYTANTNTPTDTIFGGAANGCDSIVTLNLTLTTPTKTTNVFNECEGFSVAVGANTYTTTGIFTDVINNCDTVVTNLTINPAPQLTLIKADDNCGEQIGSVTAIITSNNPPITYNWNTGSTDSIIHNLPAGTYYVTISDALGCIKTDTTNLLELQLDCDIFVYLPNAFTPNGDGNNDVFFIRGKGIATISIKIYNRWGNKVFETDDINEGWDGKHNGSDQNTAVFVYVVEGTFLNNKTFKESGDVSLIR